jgi:hypothetical protein
MSLCRGDPDRAGCETMGLSYTLGSYGYARPNLSWMPGRYDKGPSGAHGMHDFTRPQLKSLRAKVSAQSMPPGWDRAPPTQGFNPRGGFDAYAQQPFDPYRDPYAYEQGPPTMYETRPGGMTGRSQYSEGRSARGSARSNRTQPRAPSIRAPSVRGPDATMDR